MDEEEIRIRARARARAAETGDSASWSDVLKQAPAKAATGVADMVLNAPQNLGNLATAANEMFQAGMAPESYNPADATEVATPSNTTTDFMTGQGFIDPNLRNNMTPAQQITDTAVQGLVGGAMGGGAGALGVAKNALVGGLSNAVGETVSQTTGSEALGLATAILSPVGASRVASLNRTREVTQSLNEIRDRTFREAQGLGFVVVPEGKVAEFAGRPKLLQAASGINQRRTNDVARNSLGIAPNVPLTERVLNDVRGRVYSRAYEPLRRIGRVTTDNDYLDDLARIEREYTGAGGSFPEDVSPRLRELVDNYLVPDFDTSDVVDKIKVLRRRASKNIGSEDPTNNEYGFAQQHIAEAMEGQLERSAAAAGWPSTMLENYREARRLIAVSHTIGSALNSADGNVNINKLAKVFERGNFMDGDLLTVARFGSINKPKASASADNKRAEFTHLAGAAGGFAAARALDLPEWAGPLLAMGGWKAGEVTHGALSAPIREYLLSRAGQARTAPNYANLGIDSRSGPLSGMMFENSQGAQ